MKLVSPVASDTRSLWGGAWGRASLAQLSHENELEGLRVHCWVGVKESESEDDSSCVFFCFFFPR